MTGTYLNARAGGWSGGHAVILKTVEYRDDVRWKRRLSDVTYLFTNPAVTLGGTLLLAVQHHLLFALLLVHGINLFLYKAVPMYHWGVDARMDLSNHVSSLAFFLGALWLTGAFTPLAVAVLATFLVPLNMFSVVYRGQHSVGGAGLGLLSSALIVGAWAQTGSLVVTIVVAVGVVGVLYAATVLQQDPVMAHAP